MDEHTTIVSGISAASAGSMAPPEDDGYPRPSSGPKVLLNYALAGVVGLMAIITFILGLVRAVQVPHYGASYFMLGVIHVLLVFLESFLIFFARSGALEGVRFRWFYVIAALTLLHCIFTDVAMYDYD